MRILTYCLLLLMALPVQAKEGMWIPLLLGTLNEADMQSMGMKMSAEDIYSVNQSSLKDAIVKFGRGCTGEIVSRDGLLLTNHHCGYGVIQSHSSVENDYLTNGFWAMSRSEELHNPGLTVTFIVRIEDVTQQVLGGLAADLGESARQDAIDRRIDDVGQAATEGTHYSYEVKPFFYGNEYYMFVLETFKDVRLVGAPPSSIGKFGGDTDNWVWPRHTGDFSLFRVYTAPDGTPAEYAEENIPLQPRHFLPISLKGVQEGDFTMVFGFPARTQEYLTSDAVNMIMTVQDPIRIKLRTEHLAIIDKAMAESDKVRIQYASKQSGISNGWKKWKGEVRGLKRDKAVAKKKAYEAEFMRRVNDNPEWKAAYGVLLDKFEDLYEEITPVLKEVEYFGEAGWSIEVVRFARQVATALNKASSGDKEAALAQLRKQADRFFKDYHAPIDKAAMAVLLAQYAEGVPQDRQPKVFDIVREQMNGDFASYADYVFTNSNFVDQERFERLLMNFEEEKVVSDPAFILMSTLIENYLPVQAKYSALQDEIDGLSRTYMKALREVFAEETFYPDANFTLRVSYGKAEGMKPMDGVVYKPYTTLDGVVAKYIPGDKEFDLPEKLIELHKTRDYGPYADADGNLRVCFIASNHTSGGNSGSPVIDGEGNLIGLNFDRNWEGTMSDVNYDIRQCRNISVDARYVLFLIDKVAGAGYLLEEMNLVRD